MQLNVDCAGIALQRSQSLRVCGVPDMRIDCIDGCLWITQDNDVRDVVLQRGESFTLDRSGIVIVYACSATSLVMHEALHSKRNVKSDCDKPVHVPSGFRLFA